MVKKILNYTMIFISLFILLSSDVLADTYETFDVTWYYRNKSNENNLLNVVKDEESPLYASTNEYVNGYTTRIEKQFSKDLQYIVNYNLRLFFSPEQELNYRSDTLQRIIDYSFVDNDFKILNVTANESWNRSTSSGDTALTIKVSMQVLALNNTDAIRFGVYTTNNISIGFYNHTSQIDYYLLSNININDNSEGTIIDQNNQIIQGQDDINQSIIDGNKETQEVIKDQFNKCRPSYNLFNGVLIVGGLIGSNGLLDTSVPDWRTSDFISINSSYVTVSFQSVNGTIFLFEYDENKNFLRYSQNYMKDSTFELNNNTKYVRFTTSFTPSGNIQLVEGSSAKPFEPYGEEICSNRLDEAEETRKGILQTIIDLPKKIIDFLIEALKNLFIPKDGYFENWFNTIKVFFENKLGFLATPFTIIIDFINRYLNLNPNKDIIINIPDISVPNFEEHIIIKATSLNWSELLKSKESLNMMWELYLAFVDVFLILNFINLCENKYNRIFGGDTTQYEYYTVEDSYTVDDNTGEVKNHRHNQRTTTRKKVN